MIRKHKESILLWMGAFLGAWGISYTLGLAGVERPTFSVLTLFFMGATYELLKKMQERLRLIDSAKQRKRRIAYMVVVTFLFALTMIVGWQLQKNGMTESGFAGKIKILINAFCLMLPFLPASNIMFEWIEQIGTKKAAEECKCWKSWKVWLVSALSVFILWIPVWLAYYPLIMSYDFHRQITDAAQGLAWFNPHHPLAHTWLLWLFMQLGKAVGSYETGMAWYAILHMTVMAMILAYTVTMLYRIVKKKWMVIAVNLFYALFPFSSVMVICSTKDVLFSGFFLLFLLLITERFFLAPVKAEKWLDLGIVADGILMILFRNNALYAVIVFILLLLLLCKRKEKIYVLILGGVLIAGGIGATEAVYNAVGAQIQGNKAEMYSVPMAQFARVGFYHQEDMDEETHDLLDKYVREKYWSMYYPPIVDGVKAYVSNDNFPKNWKGNIGQVFQDWAKIGMIYPNEYIDAFLELTRGYWFPDDVSYAEMLGTDAENRRGVLYTYSSSESEYFEGIKHETKFPWLEEKLELLLTKNEFYQYPMISMLFKTSMYCWVLLLLFISYLYKGQKRQLLIVLYPLIYFGTMLLGPTANIRYVYPIMISIPVLFALLWLPKAREAARNKEAVSEQEKAINV